MSIRHKIQEACALHRITPFRRRYILTSNNRLRLRYVALCSFVSIGLIASTVNYADGSNKIFSVRSLADITKAGTVTTEMGERSETEIALARQSGQLSLQDKISSGIMQAAAALTAPPFKKKRNLTLQSGQTLAGVLQDEGVSGVQAYYAVKAMEKHFDPRKVRPGQKIALKVKPVEGDDTAINLQELIVKIDTIEEVKISAAPDNSFSAELVKKPVSLKTHAGFAKIQTSVYGSAAKAGVPSPVTADVIRIFSWDVDFQRDIRSGDDLEILYETYETDSGDVARYGNILYANLSVGGVHIPVYRFKMKNGDIDYFTEDGWSIKKALMKTPIDGARLSSGFGMRKHPILGYNKMHKGVDFAAPTGTPIYAAGDGTVEFVGRRGAYGNYIRIRHNSELKTAYAHLHRYAKKMGQGKRVKQGQIIGYVGSTGRSTGPHLHYEVLLKNKQVNPNRVDLPTGEKLKGQDLKNLKARIASLQKQYKNLNPPIDSAQRHASKQTTIR